METIFDHNITLDEAKLIPEATSLEDYLDMLDQDYAYYDIAYLYFLREDADNVRKYVGKINDVMLRQSFWRTMLHP